MCLKVFKDFCSQRAEKRRVKLTRIVVEKTKKVKQFV